MKKLFTVLLTMAMMLSFVACKDQNTPPDDSIIDVNLEILIEQDDSMINTYSLLAVNDAAPFEDADGNPVSDVALNTQGADALINWLLSEEGKELAANFGYDEYGQYLFYLLDDGASSDAEIPQATEETKLIRMSTTTSVNDSSLLGYLIPKFEEAYGYKVEIFSAGTGKAIANAKCGNADLILVHAKAQEEDFIKAGFARTLEGQNAERLSYMYNYFVLCGPPDDPVGVKGMSVTDAFAAIAEQGAKFVSRGDGSGTHTKELSLWPQQLGISEDPTSFADYDWYISSNAGMGACLLQASEQGAYILSDKATFLTFVANGGKVES